MISGCLSPQNRVFVHSGCHNYHPPSKTYQNNVKNARNYNSALLVYYIITTVVRWRNAVPAAAARRQDSAKPTRAMGNTSGVAQIMITNSYSGQFLKEIHMEYSPSCHSFIRRSS